MSIEAAPLSSYEVSSYATRMAGEVDLESTIEKELKLQIRSLESKLSRAVSLINDLVANLQEGPDKRSTAVFATGLSHVLAVIEEEA